MLHGSRIEIMCNQLGQHWEEEGGGSDIGHDLCDPCYDDTDAERDGWSGEVPER